MTRIEVAGDICWRRPRPTRGCTADNDDDDDVHHLIFLNSDNGQSKNKGDFVGESVTWFLSYKASLLINNKKTG